MPRARSTALLAALAVLAAGCGAGDQPAADRFEGEERRVAQVVEDLSTAGTEKDGAARICSRILSKALVDRLSAGAGDCVAEISRAVDDADEFELTVEGVRITGTTATARVKDGTGRTQDVGFVREGQDWRASSLGSAS